MIEDVYEKIQDKENTKAINKLADYLARRDHSVKELHQKLSKHFNNEAIDWALNKADEDGWLTDPQEMAENLYKELHKKKKSHYYISNYLHQKGLPEVEYETDNELEKALVLVKSKFQSYPNLSFEDKQKVARYLNNRGFNHAIMMRVINEEE